MRWFQFRGAEFLITMPDVDEVSRLEQRWKAGELTKEGVRRQIFYSVLIKWKGIGADKPFSLKEKLDALFNDVELQEFVLTQSAELLGEEVLKVQNVCDVLEKRLLESGKVAGGSQKAKRN